MEPIQDEAGNWSVTLGQTRYPFPSEIAARAFVAAVTVAQPAALEWITGAKALLRTFEAMLAEAGRLRTLYEDNDLLDLTLATPDGENVPGMGVTKLRSIAIGSLLQDVVLFLSEPTVGEGGMTLPTRRKVIVQRD
ncbi:MAG: hypothetical protein WCF99_03350 [Chloroflexales bacterium]